MPQTIKDKIRTSTNFSVHHGILLLEIRDIALQEKLADEVLEKRLTVKELEKKVKEITKPKEEAPPAISAQKAPEVKEEPTRPEAASAPIIVKPEDQSSPATPTEPQVITKPEQFAELVRSAPSVTVSKEEQTELQKQRVFSHELVKQMKDTGFVTWNDVIEALSPEERPDHKFYDKKVFAYQFDSTCPACHQKIIVKTFSYYPLDFKNTDLELVKPEW